MYFSVVELGDTEDGKECGQCISFDMGSLTPIIALFHELQQTVRENPQCYRQDYE